MLPISNVPSSLSGMHWIGMSNKQQATRQENPFPRETLLLDA